MEQMSLDYGVELHVHYNLQIFAPTKCLWKHVTDNGVGTAGTCALLLSGRCWFLHPTRTFKIIAQHQMFYPHHNHRPCLERVHSRLYNQTRASKLSLRCSWGLFFLGWGAATHCYWRPTFRNNLVVTSLRAVWITFGPLEMRAARGSFWFVKSF